MTSLDRESGHSTVDARDASVSLAQQNGEWVITTAESKEMPAGAEAGRSSGPAAAPRSGLAGASRPVFFTVCPSGNLTGAEIDTSSDAARRRPARVADHFEGGDDAVAGRFEHDGGDLV